MPDFLAEFLLRLGVMLLVILIVVAAIWFALKTRGGVKQGVPIDPADMRTWSLGFALADAAVFALIYALVSAWIGQGGAPPWRAACPPSSLLVFSLGWRRDSPRTAGSAYRLYFSATNGLRRVARPVISTSTTSPALRSGELPSVPIQIMSPG